MVYTTRMPTQAPAENHNSEMPVLKVRPAVPNRLPEPIQVQTSVATSR